MTGIDLSLIAVGAAGVVTLSLLLLADTSWSWRRYGRLTQKESVSAAPFWLGLVSLFSLAAMVFSIHALLVVHGVLKK